MPKTLIPFVQSPLMKLNGSRSFREGTGQRVLRYMFTQIAKIIYEDPPKQIKRKTVRITSQYNEGSEEGSFMSKIFSFC